MSNFKAKALEQGYPLCVDCREPIPKEDWPYLKDRNGRCIFCWRGHEMDKGRTLRDRYDQIDRRYR